MRANFDRALALVLRYEGGFADHPDDPGGATNLGITRATLAAWRGVPVSKDDVRALGREEAAAIYRARYWAAVAGDSLPAGLDLAMFDFSVNSGPSRAVRALQAHLGVAVDGLIGPDTLNALSGREAGETIRALCAARLDFLRGLATFAVFGRGWTARVEAIEREARRMAAEAATFTSTPKETDTMELTKTFLASRTVWMNAIGFGALMLSWLGFDTSGIDRGQLADTLLQAIAAVSFIASTVFRVIATKRLA